MPRIIAGSAGGRTFKVPGAGTRPTSDRVREALFSLVEARLGGPDAWAGVAVLDLYAGSGALSLEALSRGAARAALVESSRAAARVAAANAEALGLSGRAEVACATVDRALAGRIDGPFDLVFLDPPYSLDGGVLDAVLASLATGELLAGHALVTVERSARDAGPDWPDAWEALGARRYGETAVHLAQTATAP